MFTSRWQSYLIDIEHNYPLSVEVNTKLHQRNPFTTLWIAVFVAIESTV